MASNPSSVWYWNDWTGDLELKKCTRAAQGFWMQLLAIAAAATPRGHVIVGDKPCTVDDLARILGDRKRSVSGWLRELEANGVFSRTDDGTMFCRRMVRETENERSKVRSKRGRARQNGALNESNKSPKQLELPEVDSAKTRPLTQEERSSSSKDSTSTDKPETLNAACAEEKNEEGNPEEARYARLGGREGVPTCGLAQIGSCRPPEPARPVSPEGWPRPPPDSVRRRPKSPALKAKIREQLVSKHGRFLAARKRPAEVAAYWAAMLGDDAAEAQRTFDATDRRMRRANWDDMRQWKHQHGIAA